MISFNPSGPKVNSEIDWKVLKEVADSLHSIVNPGMDKDTVAKISKMISEFKVIENLQVKQSPQGSQDHGLPSLNQKVKLETSFNNSIYLKQFFEERSSLLKDLTIAFQNLKVPFSIFTPLVNLKKSGALAVFEKAFEDLKKVKEDIKELNNQIQSIREEDDGDIYESPLTPDQQTRIDALEGKKKVIFEQMDQILKDIEKKPVKIEEFEKIILK